MQQTPRHGSHAWADTPPVTPQGSPQFFSNSNAASTSRLASPSPTKANVSFSSIGYPSHQAPINRPSLRRTLSRTVSRILTPPRLARAPSLRQLQITKPRSRLSMTPRRLSSGSITSPSPPPPPRYYLRDRTVIAPPARPTLRQRTSSRASKVTSPARRQGGKARSSFSKGASKNAGKAKASPLPKPVLRRSARRAGVRL
ncbi:hypothetical protein NM688_g8257 [Phlebia brevispora]|uniref:Uncharacterized protein n=1 Tax=Phlebia brevispora TaxID=194682 RepID=A0ACC1RVH1_9APHY|nr:hypothetical protein NM688_g8257 [Phlebia brevispora]